MSNLDLATLLGLLADYGRPKLHQFACSGTPGIEAAGLWNCEVAIRPRPTGGLSNAEYEAQMAADVRVSAYATGTDADPTKAASRCLAACQAIMEGPRGRFYQPVDVAAILRAQAERKDAPREAAQKGGKPSLRRLRYFRPVVLKSHAR